METAKSEKSGEKWKDGGIKSKERSSKYGEVFTPEWVVKMMCDMAEQENPDEVVFRPDSTFLEPACGTGNFLVEILQRKIDHCQTLDDGITALNSIFGIDILPDNVQESRERMKSIFTERFGEVEGVDAILKNNIVEGNFLTKKLNIGEPIWFLAEEET